MAEPLAAPQQPLLRYPVEIVDHEDGIQEREHVTAPVSGAVEHTDPVILQDEEIPLSPVESHRKTKEVNEETEATTTETDALSSYSSSSSSHSTSFDDDEEEGEEPEKGTQQLEEVSLCDEEGPAAETGDICSNNNNKSQTAKDTESQPPPALDAAPSSQDELLAAALARKRMPSRGNSFFGQESLRNLLSMGTSTRQLGGGSSSQHGTTSARSTHSTTSSASSAVSLAPSETDTIATSAPPQRPPLSFIQSSAPSSASPQLEEAALCEDEDISAEPGNICSNNNKSQTTTDTECTQPPSDASSQDELLAAALARKSRPKMPSRGNSFFGQESLRNLLSMGTSTRQLGGSSSQHGERSTHSTASSAGSASSLAPEAESDTTATSAPPPRPPLSFIQSSSVPSSPASQPSNVQELVFREEGGPLGMHLDTDTLQVLEMGPPAVQVCRENQQPPHIFHGAVVVAVNGSGGEVADLWELLKDPSRPKTVQFRLAPQQQPRQNGAVASNSSSFLGFSLAKQLSVKHLFGNSDSMGDTAIPEQEEAEPLPLGTPQRSSSKAVRSMSSPSLFGSLSRQMSFKTPFFGAVPEDDNEKEEDDDEEDNQTKALTRNEAPLSTKNEHNKKQPPKRTPSDCVTLSSSDVSSVEMAEEEEEEDEMEVYQRARQSRLLNDICDLELELGPKTTTATSVGVKRVRFHIDDTTTTESPQEDTTTEDNLVSAETDAREEEQDDAASNNDDECSLRWYHHKELQQFESEMLDQVRALWNEEKDRSTNSQLSQSSSSFLSSLLTFPTASSSSGHAPPETPLQCFRQALRTSRRARGEEALEAVRALLQQGDWLQPVYDTDNDNTTTFVGLEQRLLRPSRGTPVGCVRFVLEQAKYQEKREQDHNDNDTLAILSQIVSRPSRLLAQEVARAQAAALRADNHND